MLDSTLIKHYVINRAGGSGENTMKLKNILFLSLFIAAILAPTAARAIEGLPPGTEDVLADIQRTMYPPSVYSVELSPDPPQGGEPVTVTAEIHNDVNETDDETLEVNIFYSLDGGETWEYVEMEQQDDEDYWVVELPAFESGDEVLYGFQAKDSSDNIYTETPCYVTSWPPRDDSCMFPIAVDETPVDDNDSVIPEDFDYLSLRAGESEDFIYLENQVQGLVGEGSIAPVFIQLYGFALQNPDKGDPSNIVTQGFVGVYAPLADVVAYHPCMTISMPSEDALFSPENIECAVDGESLLWFRVNKRQIGKTPSGFIKLLSANGAITNISPLSGVYYDYTHVSTLSFTSRSFDVE